MIESRVVYKDGPVKLKTHGSVAEAKKHCRVEYTADERVSGWQVVVYEAATPIVHYSQPEYEKR